MESPAPDQELAAIRAVIADLERFQSDLEGFDRLLARDVDIINVHGRRVRGKDNIYQARKQALQTPLAQVLASNELQDIRFLRPDVALVSCIKQVSDQREAASTEADEALPEQGRLTCVLVKEQDRWLLASYQVTPIKP